MKKLSLIILILGLVSSTSAQSNPKGRFSLSAGFDLGVHLVRSEYWYQGNMIEDDTTGAGTKLFQFNAHYSFAKWFSAGLGFKTGSYIEDPNDPDSKYQSNSVGEFYLDTRFYFVNKEKFNMYAGLSFGKSTLDWNYNDNIFYGKNFYSGPSNRLAIGLDWYLSKYVGFWYSMDFATRNFRLQTWEVNGVSQSFPDSDYYLKTKGLHIAIGCCFKFK